MVCTQGSVRRSLALLVACATALVVPACTGKSKSANGSSDAGSGKGTFGEFYLVSLSRPVGGTITSGDGQINCGTVGGTANACGPAMYLWGATATFTAEPDAGQLFQSWAGDCIGAGTCSVDTVMGGADKWIAAVFNPPDQLGHARITSPSLHAPLFFDFIGGKPGVPQCTRCHGNGYQGLANAPSCNDCHAAAGWTAWQSNCSFCHGAKNPVTQGGYVLADHPTWSAPPDAIYQRLSGTAAPSRTGAHQAHLTGLTSSGVSYALPFACSTCHAVPTVLGPPHIDGSQARAEVALVGLGKPSLGTYSQATGTCTTWCHGPVTGSPASPTWSAVGLACDSCHGLPPATTTGHPSASPALTGCGGCHPGTMNADGSLNVAGGLHVNGIVEATGGHGDYTSPAVHAPRFFDSIAGVTGALNCAGCHGSDYGGGTGPSCNACHATAGWTSWQTNCSFCHGVKDATTRGGYVVADHPTWSAPPDAISQRLTGTAALDRTGAHRAHLTGLTSRGLTFAKPFACSTCHVVPSALPPPHIDGAGARADVALTGLGKPSLGTYNANGTCTTWCHGPVTGAPASPVWSSTGLQCGACHGLPPTVAQGHPDLGLAPLLTACSSCHPGTMNADGSLNVAGGLHVDGTVQADGHGDFTLPTIHAPQFFDSLGGVPGSLNCTTCHGATYDGGAGPSCNSCHASKGWTSWQTNCSFCHGAKNANTMGGYSVALNPAWAAPPDAVNQRLTGTPALDRTGAHQAHLTGIASNGLSYALPFACATCHIVPTGLGPPHIDGSNIRATVALNGAGQRSLPANLGTYNPANGNCTTYCHGSTLVSSNGGANPIPVWNSPIYWPPPGGSELACSRCHGSPPNTGEHVAHFNGQGLPCGVCHLLTSNYVPYFPPSLLSDVTYHVDGAPDVYFGPASWANDGDWDHATRTCAVSCHNYESRVWPP